MNGKHRTPEVRDVAPGYLGPDFFADPYPFFDRLRACGGPVWSGEEDAWLVSRHAEVEEVLRDTSLSVRTKRAGRSPISKAMVFQDPPEHTRLRGLIADLFTPTAVRTLEPRILHHADRLLDAVIDRRRMEFVADFALPFPVAVISELMGMPTDAFARIYEWSRDMFLAPDPDRSRAARDAMTGFMIEVAAGRGTLADGCMLGALAEARDAGTVSTEELVETCFSIYFAGHETTTSLLGSGLFTLLNHPEDHARLADDPGLIPTAIEEMVRYESPLQRGLLRCSTTPTMIGGRAIGAGDEIVVLLGAANRDPDVFHDAASFRIDRHPNPHIAFGGGPHFCLGAKLARTEARIGFERLLKRCGVVRPVGAEPSTWRARLRQRFSGRSSHRPFVAARWRPRPMFRALESLAVEW